MDELLPRAADQAENEQLYFWAFGDLHYRVRLQWHAMHSQRMAIMFQDLSILWLNEGSPAFCVAPGDIVDTGALDNYKLAKRDLAAHLGNLPFYPGIGNHEYHAENKEDSKHTAAEFSAIWGRPIRYSWTTGNVICVMLDHPNPYELDGEHEHPLVILPEETLSFLDTTLESYPEHRAIIFAHCPLTCSHHLRFVSIPIRL
jgi:Calcineurin-like phosphoesterase